MNLPQYKAHKIVGAAKVVELITLGGRFDFRLKLETGEEVEFPQGKTDPDPVGGYYVQYADGYTSWSPAKAFEEGYTLQPAGWRDRVIAEKSDMAARLTSLNTFVGTQGYLDLPRVQQDLLTQQSLVMAAYLHVLILRLEQSS